MRSGEGGPRSSRESEFTFSLHSGPNRLGGAHAGRQGHLLSELIQVPLSSGDIQADAPEGMPHVTWASPRPVKETET